MAFPARPTTMRLFVTCCPGAVYLYEQGAPQDRSIFATGTAAHDVLEAIGSNPLDAPEKVAEDVCSKLINVGRAGVDTEPPLAPDAVFEGRDLALRYHAVVGVLLHANYEVGLGFGPGWTHEPYEEATWARARLDVVDLVTADDEETWGVGLMALDYKSAWPAGEADLDSIQAHFQVVAVAERWRDFMEEPPNFIRRRIANLRTLEHYDADTWIPDDDRVLAQWKRDAELLIAAVGDPRPNFRPGINCYRCPYVGACAAARDFIQAHNPLATGPADVARAYAVAEATANALKAHVRELTGKGGEIAVDGGVVGHVEKEGRSPISDVHRALWKVWTGAHGAALDESTAALALGLLKALEPGVTSIEKVIRVLAGKDKTEKELLAGRLFRPKLTPTFGVYPNKGGPHVF